MQNLEKLNTQIVEFYEKLSSWEQSIAKERKISLAHLHIAEILGLHGAMKMKDLASKMGVTMGTASIHVEKMLKNGYLTRKSHDDDRRAIMVDLTRDGYDLYKEHDLLHLSLLEDITSKLSIDQKNKLLEVMSIINDNF